MTRSLRKMSRMSIVGSSWEIIKGIMSQNPFSSRMNPISYQTKDRLWSRKSERNTMVRALQMPAVSAVPNLGSYNLLEWWKEGVTQACLSSPLTARSPQPRGRCTLKLVIWASSEIPRGLLDRRVSQITNTSTLSGAPSRWKTFQINRPTVSKSWRKSTRKGEMSRLIRYSNNMVISHPSTIRSNL